MKNGRPKSRRDVFLAVADPTRRAIIMLLATNTLTPNALAEHFKSSRQAVSKHIRILTECDLVRQEPKGREIYYYVNSDKMKEIENWLHEFRRLWATRFSQLDLVLNKLKKKK